MGVFKQGKKWRARFHRNGKSINVGTFKTKKEATVALEQTRSTTPVIDRLPLEDVDQDFAHTVQPKKAKKSFFERLADRFKWW